MKVEIKFKVDVPDVGATEQEIEDWLRFSFGDNAAHRYMMADAMLAARKEKS